MEEIIQHLHTSIEDAILSKSEKVELKSLVSKQPLSEQNLSFLRSKIYSLAKEKATAENFSFILDWTKAANNLLIATPPNHQVRFLVLAKSAAMQSSGRLMRR